MFKEGFDYSKLDQMSERNPALVKRAMKKQIHPFDEYQNGHLCGLNGREIIKTINHADHVEVVYGKRLWNAGDQIRIPCNGIFMRIEIAEIIQKLLRKYRIREHGYRDPVFI